MFENITDYLVKWKAAKDSRQQLQDIYLFLGVAIVVASGLMTFINVGVGYFMVRAGMALLAAFILNAVAWHFVSSAVISKIKKPRKTNKPR